MKSLLTILFLCFVVCAQGYSDSFLEYMKEMENSVKSGWNGERWYPHNSVEGGSQTIAYGHKIKSGEDYSFGLTESEAIELLISDLRIAEARASNFIKNKHGVNWNTLPLWKREVFIDYQFNGVLQSFPKFTKAVLCDDLAGMYAEFRRYARTADGERIELKARNSGLQERYLEPLRFIREKE